MHILRDNRTVHATILLGSGWLREPVQVMRSVHAGGCSDACGVYLCRNGSRQMGRNAVVVPRWRLCQHRKALFPCLRAVWPLPHLLRCSFLDLKGAPYRTCDGQVVNCTCGKSNNLPFCDNSHRLPWSSPPLSAPSRTHHSLISLLSDMFKSISRNM